MLRLATATELQRISDGEAVADSTQGRPPEFSDDALALRFAERHENHFRYVAKWAQWMMWDGRVWKADETMHAFDCVRHICREASQSCNKPRVATGLADAKTIAGVEKLAKADRRLAATADQWDADPWLLNTPDGIVDLRTGETRDHEPEYYQTRITAVGRDGYASRWRLFLSTITDGNPPLQDFLKRMAGYCLTGVTTEQCLFFLFGTGANGKSVFTSTVAGILGDYHRTAAIETFTSSNNERHPTDLAGLRGARLVTATETEEGRRWAESRIKVLTGGDRIAARFMRQDFFEFVPQFKLVIAGNHKPGLRSVDEAIRRRFHLVPFDITIPPAQRDPHLSDALKEEWPGILDWMIEGCTEWQQQRLAPPDVVTNATSAYLDGQDAIAAWIEDRCDRNPNAWDRSNTLFGSWKNWAENNGEPAGDTRQFGSGPQPHRPDHPLAKPTT